MAGAVRGAGEGRSKKEAEQQAAEHAWLAIREQIAQPRVAVGADQLADAAADGCGTARPALGMPELPEVEVVRRGLERHAVGRHDRRRRAAATRVRSAVTSPVRRTSPAACAGGGIDGGPPARQVPLAPARRRAMTRCSPTSGMSGQFLLGPPRHARRAPPARPDRVRRRRAGAAVRRPAHVRWAGARRPGPARTSVPLELAHVARDPLEAGFDDAAFARRAAPPPHRAQARAARPDAGIGDRQHLRRRGALAGAAALRAGHRGRQPARDRPAARRGPGGVRRGARCRWHVVRRAVRGCERPERLLRPLARGVRPGRSAVSALRDADPARVVHEPLVVPVPAAASRALAAPRWCPIQPATRLRGACLGARRCDPGVPPVARQA